MEEGHPGGVGVEASGQLDQTAEVPAHRREDADGATGPHVDVVGGPAVIPENPPTAAGNGEHSSGQVARIRPDQDLYGVRVEQPLGVRRGLGGRARIVVVHEPDGSPRPGPVHPETLARVHGLDPGPQTREHLPALQGVPAGHRDARAEPDGPGHGRG